MSYQEQIESARMTIDEWLNYFNTSEESRGMFYRWASQYSNLQPVRKVSYAYFNAAWDKFVTSPSPDFKPIPMWKAQGFWIVPVGFALVLCLVGYISYLMFAIK